MGDQGYSAIEILRNFYGDNMYINTAEEISGIPASWPGNPLDIGSSGPKVRQIQEQLNVIANSYPALPKITADGIYGECSSGISENLRSSRNWRGGLSHLVRNSGHLCRCHQNC